MALGSLKKNNKKKQQQKNENTKALLNFLPPLLPPFFFFNKNSSPPPFLLSATSKGGFLPKPYLFFKLHFIYKKKDVNGRALTKTPIFFRLRFLASKYHLVFTPRIARKGWGKWVGFGLYGPFRAIRAYTRGKNQVEIAEKSKKKQNRRKTAVQRLESLHVWGFWFWFFIFI